MVESRGAVVNQTSWLSIRAMDGVVQPWHHLGELLPLIGEFWHIVCTVWCQVRAGQLKR
jgi:hypothetical protein